MFVSIVLFIISIVFMILAIIISKAVKEINAGLQEADTAFDELDSKKGRIIQFFTKPWQQKNRRQCTTYIMGLKEHCSKSTPFQFCYRDRINSMFH